MHADAEPLPSYDAPELPFARQRSELRAAFGRSVGGKLDSTQGLWRYSSNATRPVQLYIGENFLTAEECRQLSEKIDSGSYPSPLHNKDHYAAVPTSHRSNLD